MSANTPHPLTVANPESSGGKGPDFERRVATHMVCYALTGISVEPLGCRILQVWLQAGHLGCAVEDIVCEAESDDQQRGSRCYWSVKSALRMTASDTEFREFCERAWQDFSNPVVFDKNRDWIGLATSTVGSPQIVHLARLTQLARSCTDVSDFHGRLVEGTYNKKLRDLPDTIATIAVRNGEPLERAEVFALLRRVCIVAFDLDQDHSQDKARTINMLRMASDPEAKPASDIWNLVFEELSQGSWTATHLGVAEFADIARRTALRRDLRPKAARWLGDLTRHCAIKREGVHLQLKSTGRTIKRSVVMETICDALVRSPVVLVEGSAGSGKSALALQSANEVAGADNVFCFAAEEFLHPHLDSAMHAAGLREVSFGDLPALIPGQHRVLVVDAVERLLQRSESREAFIELLRAARQDRYWRVLLTCRDSHAQTLALALLNEGIALENIRVPSLNTSELDQAIEGTGLETLVRDNPEFRGPLANLKWLDLSLIAIARVGSQQIEPNRDWATMSLWRSHVWHSLVRTNSNEGRQREDCLIELALERLTSQDGWVRLPPGSVHSVSALVEEGLVREYRGRFTPDHDLIEDWALLVHVDRCAAAAGQSFEVFVEDIGDSLPIRRVFRHWIGEQLDRDCPVATKWLQHCLHSSSSIGRWKDEVLLAVLGAREALAILMKTRDFWLADKCREFEELVRCLRVSGVVSINGPANSRLIGSGWKAVLEFTASEPHILLNERPATLAKLLVDWCDGQSFSTPEPIAIEAVASLVLHFWEIIMSGGQSFDELLGGRKNHLDSENDPFVQIVALCASALPSAFFESLSKRPVDDERSNWRQTRLIDRLVDSLTGSPLAWQLAKHFPEIAIKLFEMEWDIAPLPERRRSPNAWAPSCRLTSDSPGFNTPSAFEGPFLSLLRNHPDKGVSLVIRLLNHVTQQYQAQGGDRIDDLVRCEFQINGKIIAMWGHESWWQVYRGMCPWCHYLVTSALMALEAWLIDDFSADDTLELTCLDLIKRCENIAIVAVVTSVATVFPRRFTQFPVLVLQQPELIAWDRRRFVNERSRSMIRDFGYNGLPEVEDERIRSDELPHRKIQMEHYLVDAQFGPAQKGIWAAFDKFNAELNAVIEETLAEAGRRDHQVLRLLIHRMDTRNLSAIPVNNTPGTFALVPTELPKDLAEIVHHADQTFQGQNRLNVAWVWANRAFDDGYNPTDMDEWATMFQLAQTVSFDEPEREMLFGSLPAQISAACAVFFWDAMSEEQRMWCCDTLAAYVEPDEPLSSFAAGSIPPIRSMDFGRALRGLGCLCAKLPLDHPKRKRCLNALAIALTHPEHRSVEQAAEGLGSVAPNEHNTVIHLGAAALILAHARAEDETHSKYQRVGDHLDLGWQERQQAIHTEVMERVRSLRNQFANGQLPGGEHLSRLSIRGFIAHQRLSYALTVLAGDGSPLASKVFERAAVWLFVSWKLEDNQFCSTNRRRRRERSERARNPMTIGRVARSIAARCLSYPTEAEKIIHRLFWHLRVVHLKGQAHHVLFELSMSLDRGGDKESFWRIWNQCREMCLVIYSLLNDPGFLALVGTKKESAFEAFSSLVSALFFNKMHFSLHQDWPPLHGHEEEVLQAFVEVGPLAFWDFVQFVATVGGKLMPNAWKTMAEVFSRCQGNVQVEKFFDKPLWKYVLPLIQVEVTHRRMPPSAKQEWTFIFLILDSLVSQGSADAFHIREECARLRLASVLTI
jgi:hypothetical protein